MSGSQQWSVTRRLLECCKRLILSLPAPMRYILSVVAFWPTALFNRAYCYAFPKRRRIWDRIDANVILGAAPFFRDDLEALREQQRVRGVVNMCREWNWHEKWYPKAGLVQRHLPTIDFDMPSLDACVGGALFIREHAQRGDTVYVHCKAGRGRSTAVVVAYLVLFKGMSGEEADAAIRACRSHISRRFDNAEIRACADLASASAASGEGADEYEQRLQRYLAGRASGGGGTATDKDKLA